MKYAIIAAGKGQRLKEEGLMVPKPLVELGGQCLIDRLINTFIINDAQDIYIICNDYTDQVSSHISQINPIPYKDGMVPIHLKIASTPSSMHSFYELSTLIKTSTFVLTTVDTIFDSSAFSDYIKFLKQSLEQGYDGVMGVTSHIDDESPLYVQTDESMNIQNFNDTYTEGVKYISAGIYGLTDRVFEILSRSVAAGEHRMRNFQRNLIKAGLKLKAFDMGLVLDIDHASDIMKAEKILYEKDNRLNKG